MTLCLETDLNPSASSLGLDMEPFNDSLYDEALGPICGRKWSKAQLTCAPYSHIPIHESAQDYLRPDLISTFEMEEEEEDDEGPCCEADLISLEAERAEDDRHASFQGDEEDLSVAPDMSFLFGSPEYSFGDDDPSDDEDDEVIEDTSRDRTAPNDKYSALADRHQKAMTGHVEYRRRDFEDELDYGIDEYLIGKSLPKIEGLRKVAYIANKGLLRTDLRRSYGKRGRNQISFRFGYVSHLSSLR